MYCSYVNFVFLYSVSFDTISYVLVRKILAGGCSGLWQSVGLITERSLLWHQSTACNLHP